MSLLRYVLIFFTCTMAFGARHEFILRFNYQVDIPTVLAGYNVVCYAQHDGEATYRVTIESNLDRQTLVDQLQTITYTAEYNQKTQVRELISAGHIDARAIFILEGEPNEASLNDLNNDTDPEPTIYGQHWLEQIRVGSAWPHSTGHGVTVAVLDTGVDMNHQFLYANLSSWGYDFVDGDWDPSEERDNLDTNQNGIYDEGWGHGTHIAGIIKTVAPGVTIMPVRIADSDGHAELFDIVQGIAHAIWFGADIINLSLSVDDPSPALEDWLDFAKDLGITIVTSAGNENSDSLMFPANVPGVITVASVDRDYRKSDFSNFSPYIDVVAYGEEVLSCAPNNRYVHRSGTSMAAPMVSAQAAIILQLVPGASRHYVRSRIVSTAKDVTYYNSSYYWGLLGYGYMDIWNSITVNNVKK
ncbi:S8 family serine peptidase [Sulfidibacter corallicola]|uniref:S8 family serine peptidase n=1 Tax=Sulfidibacter corallicola TaxID=2818388 RepID=A0A8A4TMA1_SULCO|nr:S8 family serine peptidase [Sulfidibacter corallicola]QTD51096.1 S8 family serine peptidase [Sulfidibacter corallicola]